MGETIPNEVCSYSYMAHTEDAVAKTVEISFEKECMTQMVTVCQPQAGYGYHSYGHQYCKEIMEEKCIMVPETMDDIEMVEKCETMLSAPSCQMLELSLPKQVCTELVYGASYEVDKMEYHHAKV